MSVQIVTLGMPSVSPIDRVGTYVSPEEWNELISDPETVRSLSFFHYLVASLVKNKVKFEQDLITTHANHIPIFSSVFV